MSAVVSFSWSISYLMRSKWFDQRSFQPSSPRGNERIAAHCSPLEIFVLFCTLRPWFQSIVFGSSNIDHFDFCLHVLKVDFGDIGFDKNYLAKWSMIKYWSRVFQWALVMMEETGPRRPRPNQPTYRTPSRPSRNSDFWLLSQPSHLIYGTIKNCGWSMFCQSAYFTCWLNLSPRSTFVPRTKYFMCRWRQRSNLSSFIWRMDKYYCNKCSQ